MNNKTQSDKDKIRKEISSLKKQYTEEDFLHKSEEVLSVLEITGTFQEAKVIFIYNNLKDEVATMAFIEKWRDQKDFYLPVVVENNLLFRKYTPEAQYKVSKLGVKEPIATNYFTDYNKIDIIIVPGVAFDRKGNRLGRGKGYYDHFLSKVNTKKIGVCFDFQLLPSIPFDERDVKMDMIISENDLIW